MEQLTGYIVTGLFSLLVGLLLERFRDRPRLLYWVPGSFLFELKLPQNLLLRTDSLTIQNIGREPATDVEIIHKTRPDHFQFSTPIDFIEQTTPSGEHVIKIPSLGSNKHVNIQLLSHAAPPILLAVRCSTGQATLIQVQLQRVFPKIVQAIAAGLILVGLGFTIYWVGAAIIFISKAIGVI